MQGCSVPLSFILFWQAFRISHHHSLNLTHITYTFCFQPPKIMPLCNTGASGVYSSILCDPKEHGWCVNEHD